MDASISLMTSTNKQTHDQLKFQGKRNLDSLLPGGTRNEMGEINKLGQKKVRR